MFLFTPRVRTEGGTAKLASPGVTPKTPSREAARGSEPRASWGLGAGARALGTPGTLRLSPRLSLRQAGPGEVPRRQGVACPGVAGDPLELALVPRGSPYLAGWIPPGPP